MAVVRIPGPLRRHVDDAPTVSIPGDTVKAVVDALVAEHPSIGPHILAEDGSVQPFIHVFVRGEPAADLDGPVGEQDEVLILPSVAGGGA